MVTCTGMTRRDQEQTEIWEKDAIVFLGSGDDSYYRENKPRFFVPRDLVLRPMSVGRCLAPRVMKGTFADPQPGWAS